MGGNHREGTNPWDGNEIFQGKTGVNTEGWLQHDVDSRQTVFTNDHHFCKWPNKP